MTFVWSCGTVVNASLAVWDWLQVFSPTISGLQHHQPTIYIKWRQFYLFDFRYKQLEDTSTMFFSHVSIGPLNRQVRKRGLRSLAVFGDRGDQNIDMSDLKKETGDITLQLQMIFQNGLQQNKLWIIENSFSLKKKKKKKKKKKTWDSFSHLTAQFTVQVRYWILSSHRNPHSQAKSPGTGSLRFHMAWASLRITRNDNFDFIWVDPKSILYTVLRWASLRTTLFNPCAGLIVPHWACFFFFQSCQVSYNQRLSSF